MQAILIGNLFFSHGSFHILLISKYQNGYMLQIIIYDDFEEFSFRDNLILPISAINHKYNRISSLIIRGPNTPNTFLTS